MATLRTPTDIFPPIKIPVVAVAQRLLNQVEVGVAEAQSARLADTTKLFLALGLYPPADFDSTTVSLAISP
jgi:hypothetical protein